jgi:hypothetical protein
MFDVKGSQFFFRADRCILAKKNMVARIMMAMHLPGNVETRTDPPYRVTAAWDGRFESGPQ